MSTRPVEGEHKWADDGLGLGSYPKLPDISAQTKAPLGWWDIQERRNFGDTVRCQIFCNLCLVYYKAFPLFKS